MELNYNFGWKEITGWFNYRKIYDLFIKECKKNDIIIELGSLNGKSTCYLSSRAKMARKGIKIVSIEKEISEKRKEFNLNTTKAGVADIIYPISAVEEIAINNIKKESIFAIFIEENQTKESLLERIINWYPKISPGGVIAGSNLYRNANQLKKELKDLNMNLETSNDDPLSDFWLIRKPLVSQEENLYQLELNWNH